MPIEFLDMRTSLFSNNSSGTTIATDTPLLIGDIGLQTASVANTTNASNVRVALEGTVGLPGDQGLITTITMTIERNGGNTPGSGTLIYVEVFNTNGVAAFSPLSITASDFPPAAAVNAGQIRYTLFISAAETPIAIGGPVGFNGWAAAGTTG
ncbi:hypothetical protein [Gorillibacterium sp. sgz500922]|uniref:hypothetical protein n=1 Tax=Gorillibacterium sp. sgz500922 TaxID=3446694 RepID=UPI003F66FB81